MHVSSTDNICYLRSPERTLDHEPCALPGSFNAEAYRNGTMSRAGGFSDFVEQECSLSVDGTLCIKRDCRYREYSRGFAFEGALVFLCAPPPLLLRLAASTHSL